MQHKHEGAAGWPCRIVPIPQGWPGRPWACEVFGLSQVVVGYGLDISGEGGLAVLAVAVEDPHGLDVEPLGCLGRSGRLNWIPHAVPPERGDSWSVQVPG